jgi:hypothetical protein
MCDCNTPTPAIRPPATDQEWRERQPNYRPHWTETAFWVLVGIIVIELAVILAALATGVR